jgi:hypothetical protein
MRPIPGNNLMNDDLVKMLEADMLKVKPELISSAAYRSLTNEAKFILLLMFCKVQDNKSMENSYDC